MPIITNGGRKGTVNGYECEEEAESEEQRMSRPEQRQAVQGYSCSERLVLET